VPDLSHYPIPAILLLLFAALVEGSLVLYGAFRLFSSVDLADRSEIDQADIASRANVGMAPEWFQYEYAATDLFEARTSSLRDLANAALVIGVMFTMVSMGFAFLMAESGSESMENKLFLHLTFSLFTAALGVLAHLVLVGMMAGSAQSGIRSLHAYIKSLRAYSANIPIQQRAISEFRDVLSEIDGTIKSGLTASVRESLSSLPDAVGQLEGSLSSAFAQLSHQTGRLAELVNATREATAVIQESTGRMADAGERAQKATETLQVTQRELDGGFKLVTEQLTGVVKGLSEHQDRYTHLNATYVQKLDQYETKWASIVESTVRYKIDQAIEAMTTDFRDGLQTHLAGVNANLNESATHSKTLAVNVQTVAHLGGVWGQHLAALTEATRHAGEAWQNEEGRTNRTLDKLAQQVEEMNALLRRATAEPPRAAARAPAKRRAGLISMLGLDDDVSGESLELVHAPLAQTLSEIQRHLAARNAPWPTRARRFGHETVTWLRETVDWVQSSSRSAWRAFSDRYMG
jgi:hypothetical protein